MTSPQNDYFYLRFGKHLKNEDKHFGNSLDIATKFYIGIKSLEKTWM